MITDSPTDKNSLSHYDSVIVRLSGNQNTGIFHLDERSVNTSESTFRKFLISIGVLTDDLIPIFSKSKLEVLERVLFVENNNNDDIKNSHEEGAQQYEREYINKCIELRKECLADDEIEDVNKLLAQSVFSHKVLTDKFSIDMTEVKISCLKPGTWLNDEVINFYMCMLQSRNHAEVECSTNNMKPSHYFNSFFISKLLGKNHAYNYETIRRWTKNINVFELDKIFFPVNIKNTHWTMIVVYMKLKRIHYYDSMNGKGKDKYLIHILQWLKDETANKYNNEYIIDDEEWELIDQENTVPQQGNGFDCGMFSILCADFLSDNIPLVYNQLEMPSFRNKVCAAILRGYIRY